MRSDVDIEWLGSLSKIRFNRNELERMREDMRSIMALMDSLLEVSPVDYADEAYKTNLFDLRPDEVCQSFEPALLTSQSKGASDDCFIIHKVI